MDERDFCPKCGKSYPTIDQTCFTCLRNKGKRTFKCERCNEVYETKQTRGRLPKRCTHCRGN